MAEINQYISNSKEDKKQSLNQILRQIVNTEKFKGGFNYPVELVEKDVKPHIKGGTSLKLKEIEIVYNPNYKEKEKLPIIIRDVTRHEINHHGYKGFYGCPKNVDNHFEKFLQPIAEVLLPKGYGQQDVHYVANALEDIILHTDLHKKFNLEGIKEFYKDVGETYKGYTPFYEAFVKLNMFLWGNKKQKRELQKFYKHEKKITEVLQNFLERTGIKNMKDENGFYDKEKIREYLVNENNWEKTARIFAEEFSKLMQPGYALPICNHTGAGTKGREDENPEDEGNPFDKEVEEKDFKQKVVLKHYLKNKDKTEEATEEKPFITDNFEYLDLLYEALAKKLKIKAKAQTESKKFVITAFGKEPYDPYKHKPRRLCFGIYEGKITLMKKKHPYYINIEVKKGVKGIPECRYVFLDTSGSMEKDPNGGNNIGNTKLIPWGDNSKYHYALLGWYGLLKYLRDIGQLKRTNIALYNFSGVTLAGKGLKEAKRVALNPQFGGTYIDKEAVKETFKGRNNLILTISDGYIGNWDEIREEFIKGAKNNYFCHIQIGNRNNFTKDLEKNGLNVVYVKGNEDLYKAVIDFSRTIFENK
jgi:hypothetical protein